MILRRNHILPFLCLFLCRLHLTQAGCTEVINPKHWVRSNALLVTFPKLTKRITLVDAPSFEEMIKCTIQSIQKDLPALNKNCLKNITTSNCRKELNVTVSFMDLLCLVATASSEKIEACSHDVVVGLYSRFNLAPLPTPLPATKQPKTTTLSTTTTTTTTTAQSTTAEKSTQTNPETARPPAPSMASQSDISSVPIKMDYSKVAKENTFYSLFGLSVLLNLVFCVALLWRRRRSSALPRETVSLEERNNGYTPDNQQSVMTEPFLNPDGPQRTLSDPDECSVDMNSSLLCLKSAQSKRAKETEKETLECCGLNERHSGVLSHSVV